MSSQEHEKYDSRTERWVRVWSGHAAGFVILGAAPLLDTISKNTPQTMTMGFIGGALIAWAEYERESLDLDDLEQLKQPLLLEHGTL